MPKPSTKVEQVVTRLRGMIERGELVDDRLPAEPQLSLQMGVSRGTLRQAIEQLARTGLLVRRHGLGTFVNCQVLDISTRLEEVWDFAAMIRTSGHTPGVSHQALTLGCPTPEVAEKLELSPQAEVLTTANVFHADGVPVIYCVDILPAGLVQHAYLPEELHGPVYTFLAERCGQRVDHNITEVLPVVADAATARLLACKVGTPLHLFVEVGFSTENKPIIYSEEYYLPEYFSFKVFRKMVYQPA